MDTPLPSPAATTSTSPAPSKPAVPEPSIVERANQSIAMAKTGYDPLRPIRYTWAFTTGTIKDTLNGIAKWGPIGLKYGAIAGVVVAIALQAPIVSAVAVIGGTMFAAGALGGGLNGLLLGGKRAVGRIQRAELYAEDLIQRSEVQRRAPPPRTDYRAQHRARQKEKAAVFLQTMERYNERERDAEIYGSTSASTDGSSTYWQDRERAREAAPSQGVGF